MTYKDFLKTKVAVAPASGFEVTDNQINSILKPHQRDAVRWLVAGGRRANFASFGLGKTIIQLEACRLVAEHTTQPALITLPLGVKQEFTGDAVGKLGMEPPPYVKSMAEARQHDAPILLTNYERVRDGDIDPKAFSAAGALDEAAVLRSFGSKTYQEFGELFRGVPYKFVSTAIPSPNNYKELINYAGFLEIMDTGQALTRFFQRDSQKANNLTLYPHMEQEFWMWVSSWALFIQKPSDLGYDDEGYDLPPLKVNVHRISRGSVLEQDKDGQMKLFRETGASLQDAAKEKRDSIQLRVDKAKELVDASPKDHFILWHDLEDERHAIKKVVPEASEIYGSLDLDIREQRVIDFSQGRDRILATKKSLSGSGCNFQYHCHREIFVGIDHKFHDFLQAIHRVYRFLQSEQVEIDIIHTDQEDSILEDLMEKWRNHDKMTARMAEIIREYGLSGDVEAKLKRKMGVERVEVQGSRYTAVNNDCVLELENLPDNSMDLWHTSIPFGNHYEYTPTYNDFGHNPDTEKFFRQLDFVTPNVLRTLRPGRVMAVHVKDRVLFGNTTGTGMPTMEPFHIFCIQHYMKHGFQYFGMITVVTDVVRENNQTYRLGWTEQCKDGTKMGVGCPEYILLFRKLPTDTSTAYADVPVDKSKRTYTRPQWQLDAHSFWRSSGDRLVSKTELQGFDINSMQKAYREYSCDSVYDYDAHVKQARILDVNNRLPASFMVVAPGSWHTEVWDDIQRMNTLNKDQRLGRREMHVCPLQLDIVQRIINRYSNPGEMVGDFFAGLFTVPYMAVKMGRKGWGVELNTEYFRDGVGYLERAEAELETPTLFDFVGEGA